ncbi:MAG TPA: FMN-binding glutamate synthase family protein [Alicyclobacillus sp.]|nr:FMN-binding glutamate synthase family protein [Alicyclobacillus sp.]
MNVWLVFLSASLVGSLVTVLLVVLVLWRKGRHWIDMAADRTLGILVTDPYRHNLWEFISASRRSGVQLLIENSMRAATGEVIKRPMGSPKPSPQFDAIGFTPAQVTRAASSGVIDLSVAIGPRARRPLHLAIPILIGGMGYGVGITRQAWSALLGGATAMGTVVNTGEGVVYLEDVDAAGGRFILQWSRAHWAKEPELVRACSAVEIHFGQGASTGLGIHIPPEELKEARSAMKLGPREWARIGEQFPGVQGVRDLSRMVAFLRELSGGVPIGAKIAPGDDIEVCLEALLECDVDFITIDGAQAGTKGSEPIAEDDFGLPTFFALSRARRYFDAHRVKDVSLIISGGLATPGHFLKAIALGATAVAIGSPALYAASHGQLQKALPFEPPTELVLMVGKRTDRFDPLEGARSLALFLKSCADEMAMGIRAMGKMSIREVSASDLFALDPEVARTAGIRYAGEARWDLYRKDRTRRREHVWSPKGPGWRERS